MKSILNIRFWGSMLLVMIILQCQTPPHESLEDFELANTWADMTLFITQFTPGNSPTYASRCVGYIGLTMYESIVHGFPGYKSLSGQLNGLDSLPTPELSVAYDWPITFNAGQALIIRRLYNQTSDANKGKIDSLEEVILRNLKVGKNRALVNRSIEYGHSVAEAIFEWSKSDGGHRGYLANFDKEFVHPERPGSWKPPLYAQSFSHHPLHPYWGKNRTFVPANQDIPIPDMIPYDTVEGSAYYQQYLEVYNQDLRLTQEEKEVAIWWGDDPDETFTPPGHSFYLTELVLRDKQPDLITCAMTYAKVGMSVADAFINCWKWKFHHFSERPNTFIPQFIDEEWESFWPDPPFPAFPSGHAIQASACATALIDQFGDQHTFIDSAHVGRKRDELRDVDFVERHFNSFWDIAEETADSRFYGGIHTPQDNEVGLEEGQKIAGHVCALDWKKESE